MFVLLDEPANTHLDLALGGCELLGLGPDDVVLDDAVSPGPSGPPLLWTLKGRVSQFPNATPTALSAPRWRIRGALREVCGWVTGGGGFRV